MSAITRTQLTDVIGVHISPARVRRFMDQEGINRENQHQLRDENATLKLIQKEGGPVLPERPTKPTAEGDSGLTKEQQTTYQKALDTYNSKLNTWKEYTSPRYTQLVTSYEMARELTKMQKLLVKQHLVSENADNKKKFTTKNQEELDSLVTHLKATYTKELGSLNLTDVSAVTTFLEKLNTTYPDLVHFFNRDTISANRRRFNERAQVACSTVLEVMITELTEHAMKTVVALKKKTIQPDHCVSEGLENCSLYPLFKDLPAMQHIRNRQQRRTTYHARVKAEQAEATRKAKADARNRNKNFKPVKLEPASFEQTEVDAGHAIFVETEGLNDKVNTKCQWYGIDVPEPNNTVVDKTDFVTYVDHLTKSVKENAEHDGIADWPELLVSSNIRNFFSDLIIQFIARLLPQISLTLSFKKNDLKTVCDKTIMYEVQKFLVDSHHNPEGTVTFSNEHLSLFSLVDQKLSLLEKHNKTKADRKKSRSDTADDDESDEESEEAATEQPETKSETKPTTEVTKRRTRK